MIIKPTVGRVVWYRPSEHDKGMMRVFDDQPLDAHVAYVWNDFMVNLVVFDHSGVQFHRHSVHMQQEGGPPRDQDQAYCEWMPYQIGQAKKHEGENNA